MSAASASSSSSLTVTAAGGGAGGGIGNSTTYIERVFGGVTAFLGDEIGEPAAKRGRQNDEDVSMGMMD